MQAGQPSDIFASSSSSSSSSSSCVSFVLFCFVFCSGVVTWPRAPPCAAPGLDADSRERLRWILGQACAGFPPALIDTGMATRRLDATSLVLVTHRLAEVPAQISKLWLVRRRAVVAAEWPMPRGPTVDEPVGVPAASDGPMAAAVSAATGATAGEAAAAVGGWRHEADGTMPGEIEEVLRGTTSTACRGC